MIQQTIEQLRAQLSRPKSRHDFDAGRARHLELASFRTPSDVVRFLHRRNAEGAPERSRVLLAVLEEFRRRESPLWSALLMVAFEPYLLRTAAYFANVLDIVIDDRIEADIFATFLEAASTLPMETQGEYAAFSLRLKFRRTLKQHLQRGEVEAMKELLGVERDCQAPDDAREVETPEEQLLDAEQRQELSTTLREELLSEARPRDRDWMEAILLALHRPSGRRPASSHLGQAELRGHVLVESILDRRAKLPKLVRQAFPDLDEAGFKRECERVRGQRRRLIARLQRCATRVQSRRGGQ